VFAAAGALAQHCATGWGFPWALRARMAEMMLRGVFDTLEEGAYVDDHKELLALLKVGRALPFSFLFFYFFIFISVIVGVGVGRVGWWGGVAG
jgi:hypothetical protein